MSGMKSRLLSLSALVFLAGFSGTELHGAPGPRVAAFRADATPEIGEPLIWTTPAASVLDPLWAKGIVLEQNGERYVLCAVDWCGIGGSTDLLFRRKISAAAGTSVDKVALQSVHQHSAPYTDGDGYRLLAGLNSPPLMMSDRFLERVTGRLAAAVRDAAARLQPFDRVGTGKAAVDRVASARRILRDGKITVRYSTGGTNPELAALPEGSIDPDVRTVTLAMENRPLVRMHYYATHPQTFCCDGRVSGDFVNAAREALEKEEGVAQIYFTGCSGDVTVGKYNNATPEARAALAERLGQGMRASIGATRFEEAGEMRWRSLALHLPVGDSPGLDPDALRARINAGEDRAGQERYRAAIPLAFRERERPLPASSLQIGRVRLLHLPGEPMLEFQRYAQDQRPDSFVAVAGYGDVSPGYLCTERAFTEGGYEPSASNSGPGTEARVKSAIQALLRD